MTDYITIGPVPCNEDCAQVGSENYQPRARRECEAFRRQIRRVMGAEPSGAELVIKSFPHEFGSYLEVCCKYDDASEAGVDYAFRAEGDPRIADWDEAARLELKLPVNGMVIA
jgi:hypothetical protein